MRAGRRWAALVLSLLLLVAPSLAAAQATGAGSVLSYFGGGAERDSRAQWLILVMLVTLLTAALILGVATIAHAFRERRR
jgi:uncharacterized integral membrane protein